MDSDSEADGIETVIQTVCIGGVHIIDKRQDYDRRHKMHTGHNKYERRLGNWAKNFKRRRLLIDVLV